jgi:hypothetical protein
MEKARCGCQINQNLKESGKKAKCQAKVKKYIKMVIDMLDKLKIMSLTEQVFGIT